MRALLLALAIAGFVDDGMQPVLQKRRHAAVALTPYIFPEPTGTTCHVYFDGTRLVDTKGCAWAKTGAPTMVPASGKIPAGESSANGDLNYYSLGTGNDGLDFPGDFGMCVASIPSAGDLSHTNVAYSNGTYATDGMFLQASGTAWRWNLSASGTGSNLSSNAGLVAGSLDISCFGRAGSTQMAQLGLTSLATTTAPTITPATTTPAYIGRYSGTGLPWAGTIIEIIWWSGTPSGTVFTAEITAAQARTQ